MQNNNTSTSQLVATSESVTLQGEENYATILEQYGASYRKVDYYWQVGETTKIQGWILHISVIAPQLADLLHILLPVLLAEKAVFKLPKDKKIARNILDGNLGSEQLGKVINIYPKNEDEALSLAKQIVELTAGFKGPAIPTDIHLGGIVYTRYGAINPIISQGSNGQLEKYMYASNGELIKDSYPVPFQLPIGIAWPYGELASPEVPKTKKNLHQVYKPMTILKQDSRGNVIKALYLKGFLRVGTCVIKAGKKNMLADDWGRDMLDRLTWQKHLHQELSGTIRLPKILDFFEENGEGYLVMEYIKGKPLHDCLIDIHKNQRSWFQLFPSEQLIILDWLSKTVTAIELLHNKGFIHRDIVPGNFIIDTNDELVLIDMELAYDIKNEKQEKPFELGTPGFMSPEQEAINIPTFMEDIYGLGALMINCFTCLSALKFNSKDSEVLFQNLFYFIGNREIAELISRCLSQQPLERPNIKHIQNRLEQYKRNLNDIATIQQKDTPTTELDPGMLHNVIVDALQGLGKRPMPISKDLWLSKTIQPNDQSGNIQKEFSPYGGLHTGMTGVLYLLARAKKMGYALGSNLTGYNQSWKYIYQEYLNNLENLSPGLYNGTAGIALALASGIRADLLEDSETIRTYIQKCLEKQNEELNLAHGYAGHGIALLQCKSYLNTDVFQTLLDNYVLQILRNQQKDGSWNSSPIIYGNKHTMPLSWSQGITGVIYFLMACHNHYEDQLVLKSVNKGLNYLLKCTNDLQGLFNPVIYQKLLNNQPEIGDERTSVILCFIKAYHFLKNPLFKEVAEQALNQYQNFVVNNNFSQDGGLAALGEVYLDAWRAFKNEEWKKRALHIASVFLHTSYYREGEYCYWLMDETVKPTADLMIGNSGIIHFLLRCSNPDKLDHILLN